MRRAPWHALLLLTGAGAIALGASQGRRAGDLPEEARALLSNRLQFSDVNVAALTDGEVIRRTLDTTQDDEVGTVGAVRIGVPREFLTDRVRDIVTFKKSAYVLEIGTFSTPPRLEDLAGLSVPSEDVDAIRQCKPGDCRLKLTAAMLDRFQREVDWSRPNARVRAATLFKQVLVERATNYLAGGAQTLGTYIDKSGSTAMAEGFADLLRASPYLMDYAPELRRYFDEFPEAELRDAESFLYWSKESFSLKPVIGLTHVTIFSKTYGDTSMSFVASRGFYTSHYFEGSLALTIAMEARSPAPPAVYLVYINRSRVDALRGAFSGLRRWVAVRRVRDEMGTTLNALRKRLEQDYVSQRTSSPTAISPSSRTTP